MKLTIIDDDIESFVGYSPTNPEATKYIYCTLRPICLAHEVGHIKLGHITKKAIAWRSKSFDNLLLQELECWRYVLALHKWDTEDKQLALSGLENTIKDCGIKSVKVLTIYQEFKVEYNLEVDLTQPVRA